jgi:hypothetical protein
MSDGEYDSEHDSDVHIRMEDDVNALDGVEYDGDVDMECHSDDEGDADAVADNQAEEDDD